jgi:F-type H+-transporting ATPase subunit delta
MIQTSPLARRYARAYFDLAQASGAVDSWRRELHRAVETIATQEVKAALDNPRVTLADRVRLAQQLLDGSSVQVRNLVRLLVERRRTMLLPQLLDAFDGMADAARGVVRTEVTAAVPLDGEMQRRIAGRLAALVGSAPTTQFTLDPSIIGGLVIRIGDRVIDSSVRTQLQQLQAATRPR